MPAFISGELGKFCALATAPFKISSLLLPVRMASEVSAYDFEFSTEVRLVFALSTSALLCR